MRKYTYKFNKTSDIVLDRLNADIKQKKFTGKADSDGLQLRCVCDGYSRPSTYQLTASLTENSDEGRCTLHGEYRYITKDIIFIIIAVAVMLGFSAFMALAYSSDIGKYLLGFSAIILAAYNFMALRKRRDVVKQTEKLFDEINSEQT
ncbi:hypothetical protein ACTQ3M_10310 [Oscillospiraceae bacterium LCP25S3_E10]|nr:hypothetical protein [Ruminococcus sp.]MDD6447422.1 hypothetical protein [Ruminococcus sp.]MDY2855859.1 hypothetical protein [Oscillospiraceae bacterium]